MKIRKTPINRRVTYTYTFTNGERVTLRPNQDGVTEADIARLHRADDCEVKNNVQNGRPTLTEQERISRQAWIAAHPGEDPPKNWNLSFDFLLESNDSTATADYLTGLANKFSLMPYDEDEPDVLARLHELIQSATERQQQVYRLVVLEGYNYVQASRILGISNVAIRNHYRALIDKIRKDPAMQKFFH